MMRNLLPSAVFTLGQPLKRDQLQAGLCAVYSPGAVDRPPGPAWRQPRNSGRIE